MTFLQCFSSVARRSHQKLSSSSLSTNYSSSAVYNSNSRDKLKDTPIVTTILTHIQSIGVGKPAKKDRRRRKGIRNATLKSSDEVIRHAGVRDKNAFDNSTEYLLNAAEEREYFAARMRERGVAQRRKRSSVRRDDDDDVGAKSEIPWWVPPPPFAASGLKIQNDRSRLGRRITKRLPVKLIAKTGDVDTPFPKPINGLPEAAIIGRSNVGKSTLLNALLYGNMFAPNEEPVRLVRRRGKVPDGAKLPRGLKAATSERPGETREIMFYQLTSRLEAEEETKEALKLSMILVDLPGYGFSFAKEEKQQEWRTLMQRYILMRGKSLKRVLLLLDARHGFKTEDRSFIDDLQQVLEPGGTLPPLQIVLTKCDLVSQLDLARRVVLVKQELSELLVREPSSLPVMLVSAKPGVGFNNVRRQRVLGGVLELQRELAALVPEPKVSSQKSKKSTD
mmetsp:Transcript_7312/g.10794  ORF Transcript_7312/g.10794 Transcript_7312/m.10794 type:complete len:449 (-) Transcript_7312:181-1527(-)